MEPLMSAAFTLLESHRTTLTALIRANDAAQADRPGRFALDGISARVQGLVNRIDHLLAHPAQFNAGQWGENGRAPQIRALVREGERLREMAGGEMEQGGVTRTYHPTLP
jgi:hypothetical protein